VFVIVDNGSDHRGQAAITRLAKAHPNALAQLLGRINGRQPATGRASPPTLVSSRVGAFLLTAALAHPVLVPAPCGRTPASPASAASVDSPGPPFV